MAQYPLQPEESFYGLLLRHRGRTGLTQRELAARMGVHTRSVQDWEAGHNYPSAERLQALLAALLEASGLSIGREAAEAEAIWASVESASARMHVPFDRVWFAALLRARQPAAVATTPKGAQASSPAGPVGNAAVGSATVGSAVERAAAQRRQDWGEAPDVFGFIGRAEELVSLRRGVLDERSRLVSVLGMGGIGKTSLVAKLAQDLAPNFERVYWRGLRDAPPASDWLAGAIGFLSDQQLVPPAGESERLTALLQLLRGRRCLLVLDNFETLFEPGQREGRYRAGLAGYGHLLQAVGEGRHESCLVLTSREAPSELAVLDDGVAVRSFHLGGLGVDDAQVLLALNQLTGSHEQWAELVVRFGGNSLALKLVGESIRQVFGGEIGAFLVESGSSTVFGGIRRLLAEQIDRSSVPEQQVLRTLAVEREPVRLAVLLAALGAPVGRGAVLEAIEALRRRSLVERAEAAGAAAFTLQSVVLEYVTDRLVEAVDDEIERGQPVLIVQQPLIQAQAKDYVRQSQERLIGEPILQQLKAYHGASGTEQRLLALLESWRDRPPAEQHYGPGNVINLLRLLRGDLRGLDLSRLAIRQAYLAGVEAQGASLDGAHLVDAVLAEAFDFPGSVALGADGALLAVGTSTGQVWLWRVADRTLVAMLEGHTGPVWAVSLASDGRLLVSGGGDGTVRLWPLAAVPAGERTMLGMTETGTGQPLAPLQGHTGAVWAVRLAADGRLLASGGEDGTVQLWEASTGRLVSTLQGHSGGVRAVALSADGQLVASGGQDGTVRLWQASTGQALATLQGHTGGLWGVALSADGQLVASGGQDGTVRLWASGTGQQLAMLQGHTGGVWSVALSANGRLVASGGGDGRLRLWESGTAQPLATLQGHTGAVYGAALSADGRLLASAGGDGSVRLWEASVAGVVHRDVATDLTPASEPSPSRFPSEAGGWRQLMTLQGHTSGVRAVALAADGQLVASGGQDGTVRLWSLAAVQGADKTMLGMTRAGTGRALASLQGHTGGLWGVVLSAGGELVGSGGADGTVRLWEAATGRLLATLPDHTGGVWSLALSADGRLVASGSGDGTVRLWHAPFEGGDAAQRWAGRQADVKHAPSEWRAQSVLQGHTSAVAGLALSGNGELVASGGADGTVRLWDACTGQLLASLPGHTSAVWGIALRADGLMMASGSEDGTVRLWDLPSGRALATLHAHTSGVYGVALSADGQLLVSGGSDGIVRLWSLATVQGEEQTTLGMASIPTQSGRPLASLRGHTGVVRGVALSADGHLVASCGFDETVRLWDVSSGACLGVLRSARRYERVDITGLTGLTDAQLQALIALGAVDRSAGAAAPRLPVRDIAASGLAERMRSTAD